MSNAVKPNIPAEVADLIENMRTIGITHKEITRVAQGHTLVTAYYEVLSSIPFDTLLAALVNGYERELTEEQKRADRERELVRDYDSHRGGYGRYCTVEADDAFADGMEYALDTLGIKIEGVNA